MKYEDGEEFVCCEVLPLLINTCSVVSVGECDNGKSTHDVVFIDDLELSYCPFCGAKLPTGWEDDE